MSMNPFLLQKVLKENASDLQNFSKDLKSWGEDMKRKEETLKTGKQQPEVVKKVKRKRPEEQKAPITRIGGTDYAAWDKFDVDAELNKLEEDVDEESDLTDENNEGAYDEAIIEKEKGNKFVKNQKWKEAIDCYTKAINSYSYDPIFYANRALCYLKLNKFLEAENDCNLSLKLDDTYVKAYQRRAAARLQLNKLEHAEIDLQKVLILEPNNKESKVELDKLKMLLKRNTDKVEQRPISKFTASRNKSNLNTPSPTPLEEPVKPISTFPQSSEIIEIEPINKPPHLRSKKPLKRIQIKEIDSIENQEEKSIKTTESIIKEHVTEKIELKPNKKEDLKLVEKEIDKKFVLKTEDLKVIENKLNIKEIKNTENDNKKLNIYPKNSVQFNAMWKDLNNNEEKYKYLKLIKSDDIPKLFLSCLDNILLSEILEILVEYFIRNNDEIFQILLSFTQVRRFGAIAMFLSHQDKSNIWKLLDYIKKNSEIKKENVDELIEKYEL